MAKRLAERLEAARQELFVGRAGEKALFSDALQESSSLCVLLVHGLGGVGKTTLLREWDGTCAASGVSSALLDARDLEADPTGFLTALGAALGLAMSGTGPGPEVIANYFANLPGRVVVFVDTCELLAPLDSWLRDRFLPAMPDNALFVFAGRQAPSADWSGDARWSEFCRAVPLTNLDDKESRDYLARRDVPPPRHDAALRFTHGHPLALSLVAEMSARHTREGLQDFDFTPENNPDVIKALLEHLIQHEPDASRRVALHACSLVRVMTEDLLAAMLDLPDSHDLFNWLRDLSFIEAGANGLLPHDMVREALTADMRWRNPHLRRELHHRARVFYAAQLGSGDAANQQRVLLDYMFLHRTNPLVRPFLDWREHGSLLPGAAHPADAEALAACVERHEGAASARLMERWFANQSRGFVVLRDNGGIKGFICILSLARAGEEDLADPAVRAAWDYLDSHAPLRPGEEASLLRFWMATETYQGISPAQSLIFAHIVRHYLTTPNLAFTFLPCADTDFWSPLFAYAGAMRLQEADFSVGGRHYGVFGHDWRALPPLAWLESLGERELAAAPLAEPGPEALPVAVLSQNEFFAATQQALRDFGRQREWRQNALLRSRLVTERAGLAASEAERVVALRDILRQICDSLQSTPRENKFYRALYHAYLHPAPTQEIAAERLDLPFSTFRRHLRDGMQRVCELLWRQEVGG